MKTVVAAIAVAACTTLSAVSAQAVTLYSTGFETPTFVTGNLVGQNGWVLDGTTSPFAVITNPGFGSGQVVRGTGGTAASGGVTSSWAYVTTNRTPVANELVYINADIARTTSASAAASSFGYAVDIYATSGRVARFGLAVNGTNQVAAFVTSRFNTTTSTFDSTAAIGNVLVSGALTANTFYNLRAALNYSNKTWTLFSGTSTIVENMPFADLTATNLTDADLQVSTNANATDVGYFDNFSVTYVVPEASAALLMAGGLAPIAGLVIARRRKQA